MPRFTSQREQRLWIWVGVVVVAIYSTLGLARTLAGTLRDRGMLDNTFLFSALLIAAAAVALAFRARVGGWEIGVALGVTAAYLMMFVRMSLPETRTHIIEYGIVALFILEALRERAAQGDRVPAAPLLAFGATALIGALDEVIQLFVPSRVFDPVDIFVNAVAAAMALIAAVTLRWVRLRRESRRTG